MMQTLPQPHDIAYDHELINLLAEAHYWLGCLEGYSSQLIDKDTISALFIRREAVCSSRIEGLLVSMEDIFSPVQGSIRNADVTEAQNYVAAIENNLPLLRDFPLDCNMIRRIHQLLFEGIPDARDKAPGELRRLQVRVGRYFPPSPDDVPHAMAELEQYIHCDDWSNELIRLALIHYQFEAIHPFIDGNGRTGRIIITLLLYHYGLLSVPCLCLSPVFLNHRDKYYRRLRDVQLNGDFEQWVKFFLRAITDASVSAAETIRDISNLHSVSVDTIRQLGYSHKHSIFRLLQYFEAHPVFSIPSAAHELNLAFNTVAVSVNRLCKAGLLIRDDNSRNRTFTYKGLIDILRRGTE